MSWSFSKLVSCLWLFCWNLTLVKFNTCLPESWKPWPFFLRAAMPWDGLSGCTHSRLQWKCISARTCCQLSRGPRWRLAERGGFSSCSRCWGDSTPGWPSCRRCSRVSVTRLPRSGCGVRHRLSRCTATWATTDAGFRPSPAGSGPPLCARSATVLDVCCGGWSSSPGRERQFPTKKFQGVYVGMTFRFVRYLIWMCHNRLAYWS